MPALTRPMVDDDRANLFFKLAFATGVLVACLEIGYLVYSPLPYDPLGFMVGRDFVNTWLGAKLALTGDPAPYFNVTSYNQLLAQTFGHPDYPRHIWSYPPHLLLFTWPWALLPYMTSYVLYSIAGLMLYLAVVVHALRHSSSGRTIATDSVFRQHALVLLAMAPAVTVNLWCGQNGFLTTALIIGGITQLDRRPVLAGILFGILTIKPQLGVLLPLVLVLTGRWRVILAAATTAIALVTATSIAFGPQVWIAYWRDAMPTQTEVVLEGFSHFMVHMPTAFMNANVARHSIPLAAAIQAVVSALAVAAVIWTFRRRRDPDLSNAFLVAAIFAVTPYAFNYDMVLFGWVIIKLMERTDNGFWDYALMLAVFGLPFLMVPIGMAGVPLSCVPILALGARLVWRIHRCEQAASRPVMPAATTGAIIPVAFAAPDRSAA